MFVVLIFFSFSLFEEINERRKVAIDESMNRKRLAEEKNVQLSLTGHLLKKNQEVIGIF